MNLRQILPVVSALMLLCSPDSVRTAAAGGPASARQQEKILQALCRDNAACRQFVAAAKRLRKEQATDAATLEPYEQALTALGDEPTPALLVQTGRLLIKLERYETALRRLQAVSNWPAPPNVPPDLLEIFDQETQTQLNRLRKQYRSQGEPVKLQLQIGLLKVAMSLREPSYLTAAAADCQIAHGRLTSPQRPAELELYALLQATLVQQGQVGACPSPVVGTAAGTAAGPGTTAAAYAGTSDGKHPTTLDAAAAPGAPLPSGGPETVPGSAAAAARRAEPSSSRSPEPGPSPATRSGNPSAGSPTKVATALGLKTEVAAKPPAHGAVAGWKKALIGVAVGLVAAGGVAIGAAAWIDKDQEYRNARSLSLQFMTP